MPTTIESLSVEQLTVEGSSQEIADWIAAHRYSTQPATIQFRATNPILADRSAAGIMYGTWDLLSTGLSSQTIFRLQGESAGHWIICFSTTGFTVFWDKLQPDRHNADFDGYPYPINSATQVEELFHRGDAVSFCLGPINGQGVNARYVVAPFGDDQTSVCLAMRPVSDFVGAVPKNYFTEASGTVHFADVRDITSAVSVAQQYTESRQIGQLYLPYSVHGITYPDVLAALASGELIKLDFQFIFGDTAGQLPAAAYWSYSTGPGPGATVDIPTEARLYPESWGDGKFFASLPVPAITTPTQPDEADASVFTGPGLEIQFTLAEAKKVSLVITHVEGNAAGMEPGYTVRELLRARLMAAGTYKVYWDGRDRYGRIMPAAQYGYLMGEFANCYSVFAGSVGNSGRPAYRTADGLGSLGGVHGGPWFVASDSGGIFTGMAGEEGAQCARKMTTDGVPLWTFSTGVFGSAIAGASDNTTAYITLGNNTVRAVNTATGVLSWSASLGDFYDPGHASRYVTCEGAALIGTKLYLSTATASYLTVVDTSTHAVTTLAIDAAVSGLCNFDSTHLLACSGTSVVKISTVTGAFTAVITGLTNPVAVCNDGSSFLVSDTGAGVQQVFRYNSSFSLTDTFGVAGGADPAKTGCPPTQNYNPLKFANVTSIAVGPDSNIWMCCKTVSPRRIIKLSPTGTHLQDFFGPWGFPTMGCDLDDPKKVYSGMTSTKPNFAECTVDFDQYADNPDSSLSAFTLNKILCLYQNGVDDSASPDFMFGSNDTVLNGTGYGRLYSFTYAGANANAAGRKYLFAPGHRSGLWIFDPITGFPKAACAVNSMNTSLEPVIVGLSSWHDADGDGLVDAGEIAPVSVYPTGNFYSIERDLVLYGDGGTLAPASINSAGVPNYDGGTYTPYIAPEKLRQYIEASFAPGFRASCISNAGDGSVWLICNLGPPPGRTFHDDSSATNLILVKDGKILVALGKHNSFMTNDGDVTSSGVGIAGEVDGVVVVSDWNSIFLAYTRDGLALGWICKPDATYGGNAITVENNSSGLFVKDPATGKRYLYCMSTEDFRILEVKGVFEPGELVRTTGLIDLPFAFPRSAVSPVYPIVDYSSWKVANPTWPYGIGVDIYGWQWDKTLPTILIQHNGSPIAEVKFRRDAGQLCVYATIITGPHYPGTPSQNSLTSQFGHQTGIEIMIGTTTNPNRTSPQQGDTRIFCTTQGAKSASLNMWQGVAAIVRPASTPLTGNGYMRHANDFFSGGTIGEYGGTTPTGSLDLSTMVECPNSRVAGRLNIGDSTSDIQAEIPLGVFPEFTVLRAQNIRRPGGDRTATQPDFTGELVLWNVAVHIGNNDGTATRFPWKEDGFTGDDATQMDPSKWGRANGPLRLMLDRNGNGVAD